MKGRTIILDHLGEVEAAALMVDGKLDDLLVETDAPRPGTIYRAIADRPVKGQGGMFLKTPDGSAFLRQIKGLAPGQPILVQVSGYAEPGKAIPVTAKVLFKSRYAIVTPHGVIMRSSCADADADEISEDVVAMLALADDVMNDADTAMEVLSQGDGPHVLAWRDWTAPADVVTEAGGFEAHGVMDALDVARGAQVGLGGAASMFVEATRALIAVDVNTGNDASLAAGIKANMACAAALPRALRVRGLGGQITLDLAPMPKKERRPFENALRAAFRVDDVETTLVGWTPLGHYELQRKRLRAPLSAVPV
jgi:ribonuclease G